MIFWENGNALGGKMLLCQTLLEGRRHQCVFWVKGKSFLEGTLTMSDLGQF